jgi:hypothetical protein
MFSVVCVLTVSMGYSSAYMYFSELKSDDLRVSVQNPASTSGCKVSVSNSIWN